MKTLVIIPTYNEKENISEIIEKVLNIKINFLDILIVDGNSTDGTKEIIQALAQKYYTVNCLIQKQKTGLAGAYLYGFKYALDKDYTYLIQMDADFSHNPKYLIEMNRFNKQYDFVVGSRYIEGGGTVGWKTSRKLLSKLGSWYSRKVLNLSIKDLTGGFNCWHRKVLQQIDLNNIKSDGYCFQIELKYKAFKKGFSYKEFPIIFKDRQKGKTKMSRKIVLEALYKVWLIK